MIVITVTRRVLKHLQMISHL